MKSPSDLSMRFPSTVGQICHEMPPSPRSNLWPGRGAVDGECCLPFQLCKDQAFSQCHWPRCSLREFRMEKEQEPFCTLDTNLRQLRLISKGWFQWAKNLASSPTWQSTTIFNLRYVFFVISSKLLMFNYTFFFQQILLLIYTLAPSLPLQRIPQMILSSVRFPG